MNKRENYHLNRLLLKLQKENTLQIETTKNINDLLSNIFNLRVGDKRDDGWYNKGFVFFRFLNDCIEFKTIHPEENSKSIFVSLNEQSVKSYFLYLKKLEGIYKH